MKENTARYIHRKHLVKTKKPTFDSLKVQTVKLLAKLIKTIRGQLIQKTIRKINEVKISKEKDSSSTSIKSLETKLKQLKDLDNQSAASFVFNNHISETHHNEHFPQDSTTLTQVEIDLVNNYFKRHSKIVPLLSQFDEKLQVVLEDLQKSQLQQQGNKNKSDRSSHGSFTIGKAVFVESLNSDHVDVLDESDDDDDIENSKQNSKREQSKKKLNEKLSALLHPVRSTRSSSKRKVAELSPYGPQPGDKLLMYNGTSTSKNAEGIQEKNQSFSERGSSRNSERNDKVRKFDGSGYDTTSTRSKSTMFDSSISRTRNKVSTVPNSQSTAELHPSWAAKQKKEHTGMLSIQVNGASSKKIVFDD